MWLYREGTLVPKKKTMTFEEFATGWWDIKPCKYLEWRQLSDPFSESGLAPSGRHKDKRRIQQKRRKRWERKTKDDGIPEGIQSRSGSAAR
jgi:hypothetical protein